MKTPNNHPLPNPDQSTALRVVPGVDSYSSTNTNIPTAAPKKQDLSAEAYAEGILSGDRGLLSRAITIIESNAPKHFELGREIVNLVLSHAGNSVRLGITGVPGAGKSTTIEALGMHLCGLGKKVAVLAVDPSSALSGGSILGDKTRMEKLSRHPSAFIRPSPSGGTLGGVTRKSREIIALCEAAGFDVIVVETVGVGQSEIAVHSMVDFFLVLAITGAGDELQGIKKGIIEMADAILINKADGDNREKAHAARAEYNQVLHYLRTNTEDWETKAYAASALTGEGIAEIWQVVSEFIQITRKSGALARRRAAQSVSWVRRTAEDYVIRKTFDDPNIKSVMNEIEHLLKTGDISPAAALKRVIDEIEN